MIRVALTAALGWIFAMPLRPLLIRGLQAFHVPLPMVGGNYASLGAIALTATAGIAGWLEFLLLRHSLAQRIGAVRIPPSYLLKLWSAGALAGVAAAATNIYLLPKLPPIPTGIVICGLFGVIYFAATIIVGVPEAKATLSRFSRRR